MSTRALYTFTDEFSSWNVYKHHDGYPSGAAVTIETALKFFAWELPRFEADAFAGAFIAAAKCQMWLGVDGKFDQTQFDDYGPRGRHAGANGGGIRLMPQGDPLIVATKHCCDIEYRYDVRSIPVSGGSADGVVIVTAWRIGHLPWDNDTSPARAELLFSAPIRKFTMFAKRWEKKEMKAAA